jgi:hypothetical protein
VRGYSAAGRESTAAFTKVAVVRSLPFVRSSVFAVQSPAFVRDRDVAERDVARVRRRERRQRERRGVVRHRGRLRRPGHLRRDRARVVDLDEDDPVLVRRDDVCRREDDGCRRRLPEADASDAVERGRRRLELLRRPHRPRARRDCSSPSPRYVRRSFSVEVCCTPFGVVALARHGHPLEESCVSCLMKDVAGRALSRHRPAPPRIAGLLWCLVGAPVGAPVAASASRAWPSSSPWAWPDRRRPALTTILAALVLVVVDLAADLGEPAATLVDRRLPFLALLLLRAVGHC